ncbi:hypothetical protein QOZ80_5BG0415260 [Eleusine coracana subsp. coracana]|nr:hypothetical protein QOZ80_5BG0415260 [Eleusine coracana subsp. coracana]
MKEAPPPSVSNQHDIHGNGIIKGLTTLLQVGLLRLELVVVVSAVILAVVVLHGSVQGRSSDNVLRGVMGVAYSMLPVAVSYAVGLIQDGPFHDESFVLWATALLVLQGSAMSASERKLLRIQSVVLPGTGRCQQECVGGQQKKQVLQHVLQTGFVLWLIINMRSRDACYRVVIWMFWALNLVKTVAKMVDVTIADLVPYDMSVKVVADYMAVEEVLTSDQDHQPPDPVTMQGYRYIFGGEETMLPVTHDGGRPTAEEMLVQSVSRSVVTIDQVYRWIEQQQPFSEAEKDKARRFCLAFTLFKLLKRRFYGFVPAEAGSRKARDLVLTGLIIHDADEGAFQVVDAELGFLYDLLYGINSVQAFCGAKPFICIAAAVASVTICEILFGTLAPRYRGVLVGVHSLDRSITVFLVLITAGLEVFQAMLGFSSSSSSNRRYVKTVYRCVRDGRDWTSHTHTHLWLWLGRKKSITPPGTNNNKSWWERREHKVGQYAFLKYFRYRPCNLLSWMTLCLVERRRQGQNPGRTKPLPREARRAVLRALKQSDGRLTNGVATLQRHGLLPRLEWACMLPKFTDQILAWHVATTTYDWASGHHLNSSNSNNEHRLVARRLSNYCAYLVAFLPEMLPDPTYSTQQVFDTAVQQARDHLDGCRTQTGILARLDQIADHEWPCVQEGGGTYARAISATVIERAAVLWRQLREGTVGAAGDDDDALRWRVLAEFWAELVLFLAPSDNVEIHGRMLGSGGEFMTQLWVLLSNAGILERPVGHELTKSAPTLHAAT